MLLGPIWIHKVFKKPSFKNCEASKQSNYFQVSKISVVNFLKTH
jgi:hypothetical protein